MGYVRIKRDRPSLLTQAISTAYPPLGNNFHQHPPLSREHKGRREVKKAAMASSANPSTSRPRERGDPYPPMFVVGPGSGPQCNMNFCVYGSRLALRLAGTTIEITPPARGHRSRRWC